jgi:hypothetical protein
MNKSPDALNFPDKLKPYLPIVAAVILLLIAASRIYRLTEIELDTDEVWSIWMTLGTPQQIIQRTPYDWPPLFYLFVGAWRSLVGINPVAVSMSTIFVYLLGTACLYRVVKRLFGAVAALISMVALAGLGQTIMLSMMIRGYAHVLALAILMFWLTIRYFDHPNIRRAVWLGLCMAVMFYTHMTAVIAFFMIGLFTLIIYRGAVWRWWLPGLLAGVGALPEILNKVGMIGAKSSYEAELFRKPALNVIGGLYGEFIGYLIPIWIVIIIIAALLIIIKGKRPTWTLLLIIWIAFPLVIYIFHRPLGFMFNARHMSWVLVAMAIAVGWGIALAPRIIRSVAIVALTVAMFWAHPNIRAITSVPYVTNFSWLASHLKVGDVVLIDPKAGSSSPENWDFFERIYFPQGLHFVTDPAGYSRVWYVSMDGRQDPATYVAIKQGRIAGEFVGKWDFLIRLWEAAPDPKGTDFENGMRFLGAQLPDASSPYQAAWAEGQDFRIRLWWSASRRIELDYSTSLVVINDATGERLLQLDSPPNITDGPKETSRWSVDEYYLDDRVIDLPESSQSGTFTIYLIVYQWWDQQRIAAPGTNEDQMLPIQKFTIKAW